MRKDVKDKWIAALQSGKYHQVTGFLATGDRGRCALGVLADIATEAGAVVRVPSPFGKGDQYHWTYNGLRFSLPTAVLKWSGLTESESNAIIDMNETGESFAAIAEWIRENL